MNSKVKLILFLLLLFYLEILLCTNLQIDIRETNLKQFLSPVAIGCLNGLTGFLNNFANHIKTRDYCLRIYEILKKLIGNVEENKRHVINRSIILIIIVLISIDNK